MDSMDALREFFGWCSVINVVILALAASFVVLAPDLGMRIHGGMFRLTKDELRLQYFQYLAQYKIAVLVLNVVPYLALLMMSR